MSSAKLLALGWNPEVGFDEGLDETIDWFVENKDWWMPTVADAGYQTFMQRFYGKALGDDL
jgi:dTDP-glucose 4,6-dehydratase